MANAEEKLEKLLQKIAQEQDYVESSIEIKPISSGGANYTTVLYLASISERANKSNQKPDLKVFAKVANLNEEFRKQNEMMAQVYLIETLFYTELAINAEKIYDKNSVPKEDRLRLPKYYGHDLTTLDEILVLENLEATGYSNFDRMKSFNWEYAASAVQQMARFHALGLAFREENPKEFDKIVSQFNADNFKDNKVMEDFVMLSIKNACDAVDDVYKERLGIFFSGKEVLENLMDRFMQDTKMLIHGDFRPSNLMHRRRNGKIEVITLDFQTLRLGSPVMDLYYFIFSGSDEEFRRYHYQRLLDYYHTELTLALKKLHVDVEKVYPKKEYEQDLIETRPQGLVMGLMMTAMVTVNPEDAPKIETDFKSFEVKPNQLAKQRLNGIVKDFIRWGVL